MVLYDTNPDNKSCTGTELSLPTLIDAVIFAVDG